MTDTTGTESFPVGTLDHCAAASGIPVRLLKLCKRAGCPAFRSSRVYVAELLPWLFSTAVGMECLVRWASAVGNSGAGQDWDALLKQYKAEREKIRLDKDRGASLDADEVQSCVAQGASILFSEIERRFCNELPPVLKGMDEIEIAKRCKAEVVTARSVANKKFSELEAA